MIVLHGIIQALYVAFLTAVATICILSVCPLPRWTTRLLCYLGDHSSNIWLIHMFFYLVLFDRLVFCVRYPIPVFLLLLLLSLAASYVVELISRPILKLVR